MEPVFAQATWPGVANAERAAAGLENWAAAVARSGNGADHDFAASLGGTPGGRAMLECVFGASPFLGSCLLAEPGFVRRLWGDGPDAATAASFRTLAELPADLPEDEAGRALRIARRRVSLAVALADIAGLWEVEQVTGALTRLAELSCSVAIRVLLHRLHAREILTLPDPQDPETGSGLITLGLGKLGGGELNYSSDIDLILLYDPETLPARDPGAAQRQLVRLARNFIAMLSERTREGYAFRVDLRLRPDPGATPLVMSADAAEHYYEARGQTWERAALIKARAVAGDRAAAQAFLARTEPFVWRRHLDFATVQELHDMKKQIDAHHGTGRIRARGHNLKLGRGGIREIEFFAQVHQLVWGGKDPRLRTIPTCETLHALASVGHLPPAVAEEFAAAYRFLRRAEHRVQMVDDEQTHSLPGAAEEYRQLACFLGYPEADGFSAELETVLRSVEKHYADFFEIPLEMLGAQTAGAVGLPDAGQLARMGFADPENVLAILRKWRSGRYRVAQGPRSRELLDALTPALLTAMLGTPNPDLAIARLDRLLAGLPTGLQVFSLFQANLQVMETLADILVSAPAIGERLTLRPDLFDALLDSEASELALGKEQLRADLALRLEPARDFEDAIDRIGNWVDATRIRTAIHILFRRLPPIGAAPVLSDVADCTVEALLARAQEALARAHGQIAGAEVVILAMGRLGSREMSMTSDLDLVLVYDAPEGAVSDGARPLAAATFFNRLLRRLLGMLGADSSGTGPIYAIDMRLRPSGNAGPLATSLPAFEAYHADSAWTWERMALTRARVACGDQTLGARLADVIRTALSEPRDRDTLRRDVAEMRVRMDGEYHTDDPWSVKHYRGGLVDIEFITQYLLLRSASHAPEVLATGTDAALVRLREAGALTAADADTLLDAWSLWSGIQALQRLIGGDAGQEAIPTRLLPRFAEAGGVDDAAHLPARMAAAATAVREVFGRLVGEPEPAGP